MKWTKKGHIIYEVKEFFFLKKERKKVCNEYFILKSHDYHSCFHLGHWGVWYTATWEVATNDGSNQGDDWCNESRQRGCVCQT